MSVDLKHAIVRAAVAWERTRAEAEASRDAYTTRKEDTATSDALAQAVQAYTAALVASDTEVAL